MAAPRNRAGSAGWRRFQTPLRWLVAVVFFALCARVLLRNPEPLLRLGALRPEVLATLAVLAVLNNLFLSWRLALAVTECGGPRVSGLAWFRLVVLGQFLNLMVPQLGNVYRGVVLKREHGVSYMSYASGLFSFVWLDTVLGFSICVVVLTVLRPSLELSGTPALPVLVGVVGALIAVPVLAARGLGAARVRHGVLGWVHERATRLLATATRSLGRPRFVGRFFLMSVLVTVEQMFALWLCFRAVGHAVDVPTAALFQVVVKLSNQVQITPGNLGLTELAWGALGAAAQGGGLEHGIAASLLFRASFTTVLIALGVLFGGVGLLRSGRAVAGGDEPAADVPRDAEAIDPPRSDPAR
jgi:uncharacterized membrane protein YbhN (UPF0104 family)